MKRSIVLIVLLALALASGLGPGCASFVWDPTGVWTFTSSEGSPNTMTGNAHFVEDSYTEDYTLQANKVTNLQ